MHFSLSNSGSIARWQKYTAKTHIEKHSVVMVPASRLDEGLNPDDNFDRRSPAQQMMETSGLVLVGSKTFTE
jgi:hypothetical protein